MTQAQEMTSIPADDLRIETWPPREKGGQHVGPGPSGVRITHLPSETVAICTMHRSQFHNRKIALDMILSAITHPLF